jgi:hypothetical protein
MVQITASSGGKSSNLITGSFTRTATGSYTFVSSGSFTGVSGSYTGSIGFNIKQIAVSASTPPSASQIFIYTSGSNPNAIFINTYSIPFSTKPTKSDNIVPSGSCNLEIGIQTPY